MARRKDGTARGERKALYPGSFDPVTRGHLDIIERASRLFDRLVVGVLENPSKAPLFSAEERTALLRAALAEVLTDPARVEVVSFRGLTVDLAERLQAPWLVRGVRTGADAESELAMARTNRAIHERVFETVLLAARPEHAFIASSHVREIAALGGDVRALVTPVVAEALRRKLGGA